MDIQGEKDKKILILDDPITSLSNNNIYNLVKLIQEEQIQFSQTFIFTHHTTFFNYLKRKFKREKNKNLYYLIRNKDLLGGSILIKYDGKENFIEHLKNIENRIIEQAKTEGINFNLIIEYGQYLRYEVERLIKNELLQWNKEHFHQQLEGLKKIYKLTDEDITQLNEIYEFCNWSNTSHVGYDEQTGLDQLKNHIEKFLHIYAKLK